MKTCYTKEGKPEKFQECINEINFVIICATPLCYKHDQIPFVVFLSTNIQAIKGNKRVEVDYHVFLTFFFKSYHFKSGCNATHSI